jgi:hypothetical protein
MTDVVPGAPLTDMGFPIVPEVRALCRHAMGFCKGKRA